MVKMNKSDYILFNLAYSLLKRFLISFRTCCTIIAHDICDECWGGQHTYTGVVVAVDHDGGAAMEVDVLLPPVSDVVARPPRLQHQVALHLLAWAGLRGGREGGREGGEGRRGEREGGSETSVPSTTRYGHIHTYNACMYHVCTMALT